VSFKLSYLALQLMKCSGIHRSSTSVVGSSDGRTVDVAGVGTSAASNQGDAEGARGRTDAVKVEGKGEGEC
jgi:hypothetical protein